MSYGHETLARRARIDMLETLAEQAAETEDDMMEGADWTPTVTDAQDEFDYVTFILPEVGA